MDMIALLDGRLQIRQPLRGHRAGTDAVLLAACQPAEARGLILDIGSGVGTVGLAAALHAPAAEVVLVEQDQGLAEHAAQNIRQNGFEARMRAVAVDVLSPKARRGAGLADGCADIILTNPPFYAAGTVSTSPVELKQAAYVMAAGLDDWLRACAALLRPGGTLYLVHRAAALPEILAGCTGRFGGVQVKPVYPRQGSGASRVLIAAVKGSRAPLGILPGLILHEGAAFTAEAHAIQRGLSLISMDPR